MTGHDGRTANRAGGQTAAMLEEACVAEALEMAGVVVEVVLQCCVRGACAKGESREEERQAKVFRWCSGGAAGERSKSAGASDKKRQARPTSRDCRANAWPAAPASAPVQSCLFSLVRLLSCRPR